MIEWAYVVENDKLQMAYLECLECTERFGHPVRSILNGTHERSVETSEFCDLHSTCGPGNKFVTYDLSSNEIRSGRWRGPTTPSNNDTSPRFAAEKQECPELWTKEAEKEWNLDVKILDSIYRDNPGIKFDEAKILFAERKQSIEEMKHDL